MMLQAKEACIVYFMDRGLGFIKALLSGLVRGMSKPRKLYSTYMFCKGRYHITTLGPMHVRYSYMEPLG